MLYSQVDSLEQSTIVFLIVVPVSVPVSVSTQYLSLCVITFCMVARLFQCCSELWIGGCESQVIPIHPPTHRQGLPACLSVCVPGNSIINDIVKSALNYQVMACLSGAQQLLLLNESRCCYSPLSFLFILIWSCSSWAPGQQPNRGSLVTVPIVP